MKNLIKNILKEYVVKNSVLVFEIVFSKNLTEQKDFIKQVDKDILLFKNKHSTENVGTSLNSFSRVDPKYIVDSVIENQDIIIVAVKKILSNCNKNSCGSLHVIDNINGFDYHMWVNKNKKGNGEIIINTSIHHPKSLTKNKTTPFIVIDIFGNKFIRNL